MPVPEPSKATSSTHQSDLELVRRALQGHEPERLQLGQRLRCIEPIVIHRNQQFGQLIPSQELPDLIQDISALVWRKLPSYEARASLETWVYSICSLEILSAARTAGRRASHQARLGPEEVDQVLGATVDASSDQLPPHLRFEGLYLGFSRLSADDESVLRRRHYEDQSFEQIGADLGLTVSGAKHRYYLALKRLRQAMPRGDSEGDASNHQSKSSKGEL